MGAHQPFLYEPEKRDSPFPGTSFDPKAVTRASYEPKPRKPKPDGPLISFNRHPDAHMVLSYRSNNYSPMSQRTKSWIKGVRVFQLLLRVLELNAAIGLLVLLILITNIEALTGWVMRITVCLNPGVVMLHCMYGIYHLSRHAGGRTPTSSAAYQLFAGVSDLCVMPLYAFGGLAARNQGADWTTRLANQSIMKVFLPAVYYLLIAAAGLHFVSLCISLWLGLMFRKISQMPPDMNPLEAHLTSRVKHKKNKSSVATTNTDASERRLSTPLESHRRSGVPYEGVVRPPTIPFLRTRAGSGGSYSSRDSRVDLPSRQYQITPGNSPRNSATSEELKRISIPRSSHRGSYTEIPLNEAGYSRPSTAATSGPPPASHSRTGKFTETWSTTDSLISRTQQRARAMNAGAVSNQNRNSHLKSYEALTERYNLQENSDSESDHDENNLAGSDFETDIGDGPHPNPLRSNPSASPLSKAPYYPTRSSALSEVSMNERSVSGSNDVVEEKLSAPPAKPWTRNRNSSIQPESLFYSKPYGELKSATPPIIVGANRQLSSGNDYDGQYSSAYGRRNVSGKVVEEGRAGAKPTYSRFSVLND